MKTLKTKNNFIKIVCAVLALIFILPVSATIFAHHHKDADIPKVLAEITGKSAAEIQKMLDKGDTPYQICEKFGKVPELKEHKLTNIREKLENAVRDGRMTREVADGYYKKAKAAIDKWDGSNPHRKQ